MQDSTEIKEPYWKRRHLIVLHGFTVYFLLNAYRISMGVAIVAMVENSAQGNHTVQQISNTSTEIINGISHDQYPVKFNWSPKIRGGVLGAGFFGFMLSLILGGRLAETFGPRIMIIIGTFFASFNMMVTPLAAYVSPYFVMFIQCVGGIAQGLMLPPCTILAANWFPKDDRGLLSGISLSGTGFGILVSGILSSLICDSVSTGGWPLVFYVFGGFGIFVSILQMISLKNLPKDDPRISKEELQFIQKNQENEFTLKRPAVPWRKLLSRMSTYALLCGTFGQFWMGTYFLSVHATFLGTILHYSMAETGILISVPYVISMFVNVSSGFVSSFLSARDCLSISKIRKLWTFLGSVIYSLCLAFMIFTNSDNTVTIVSSILGIAVLGFMNSGVMIVALDMTPTFAGSFHALNVATASLSGVILPLVCGIITNEEQTVQQWNKFFILSIVIVMSAAIFFCIFGSAEIQSYNSPAEDLSLKAKGETKIVSKKDDRKILEIINHK